MLALPAPPRLARMLLEAAAAGAGAAGALLAALAGERDILLGSRAFGGAPVDRPPGASDLLLRADLFAEAERRGFSAAPAARSGSIRAPCAPSSARGGSSRAAFAARTPLPTALLRCVLAGFPDRVCRRRAPGSDRAVMVGGTGVALAPESVVREAELFVAVDVEGGGGGPTPWCASPAPCGASGSRSCSRVRSRPR